MATFGARVESLIGAITTDADMNDWVTAGAKVLVDKIPLDKAERIATTVTDSGSGIALTDKRLLRAHKSGYNAPILSGGLKAQLALATSLHYAVAGSPRAYIDANKLYVLPGGGTGVVIPYPTVLFSESAITNFPPELEQLVVLYAGIYGLQQVYNIYVTTDVGALSLTLPTIPTAPTLTTVVYANATASTIGTTTVSALATYTDYINGAVARPVFQISITTQPTAPAFTNIATEIVFTDASVTSAVINKAIDLSTQFTALATPLDTEEDIDLANAKMNEIKVRIEEFTSESGFALQEAITNAKAENDIAQLNAVQNLQAIVQNYQLQLAKYSAEISSWQEEVNASYKEHQLNLGAYDRDSQNRLQDALATFNSKLEEYKTDFQHSVTQAQIDAKKATDQAQLTTSTALQNNQQRVATELQRDSVAVQKYSSQVNAYGANVNAVVQEYATKIGIILQKHASLMAESQNLQNLYDKELTLYLG